MTGKAKVTTPEENNELSREGLNKQISTPQPMSDIITDDSEAESNNK